MALLRANGFVALGYHSLSRSVGYVALFVGISLNTPITSTYTPTGSLFLNMVSDGVGAVSVQVERIHIVLRRGNVSEARTPGARCISFNVSFDTSILKNSNIKAF